MPELLSDTEAVFLEIIYKRLCNPDEQLGFDEIAEMTNKTDEEAHKICRKLGRKKWLRVDASDVICDKYLNKEFLRWKEDKEITRFLIREISSILISNPECVYSLSELSFIVNERSNHMLITTQQLLRFMNSIPKNYTEAISESLGDNRAKEISYKAAFKLIRNKIICPE